MTYLLDVNLLVALFDRQHVNHEASHDWFARSGIVSWATCPVTENGFLRVISNPAYLTVMATPTEAMDHLERFCTSSGHVFWTDAISLLVALGDPAKKRLMGHGQITDFYLATLAHHHGGTLATFDGSLARTLEGTELEKSIEIIE
ncbi:MAG: PIN domain-containing protein [Spirochaetaceae bacterium]|nr:MAG: PIN domain-containing protein [Spirochaetaceae bacterium]